MTLKELLLKHLRRGKKTRAYLRKLGRTTALKRAEGGVDSASTDRCLRRLTANGLVEPVFKKDYIVGYVRA